MSQKINVTKRKFLAYEKEIQTMAANSIEFYWHNSKIHEWLKNNEVELKTVQDKGARVMAKHMVVENGVPKMTDGEDGKKSFVYHEGCDMNTYLKDMDSFYEEICVMEI